MPNLTHLPTDEQLAVIRARVTVNVMHSAGLPATAELPAEEQEWLMDYAQRVALRFQRRFLSQ